MSRNTKFKQVPSKTREVKVPPYIPSERVTAQREQPDLNAKIAWNFKRMDGGGKFKCSLKLLHEHAKELLKFEGKTIGQIMEKAHNHPMSVSKLSSEAKERIKVMELDEETLHQLDLKTPARLWGVLESNIFHVLWLDPEHEVCISR